MRGLEGQRVMSILKMLTFVDLLKFSNFVQIRKVNFSIIVNISAVSRRHDAVLERSCRRQTSEGSAVVEDSAVNC
jgi:hypothetical protein